MDTPPLRVAIVGYGVVGPLHALAYRILSTVFPSLQRSATLALIIDSHASARKRASFEQGVPVESSLEPHLEIYGIDVLDCCSPTGFHADVCEAALSKGIAILCEKPLTGKVDPSQKLLRLASDAKTCFGMNFNFRFVPAIQEAKRRILNGCLGKLKRFKVEYHRSSNIERWKKGEWEDRSVERGALMDIGPHAIDLVHYLFGHISELSASVQYYSDDTKNTYPDDIANLNLTLRNHAQGYVEVSKITPGAANDLKIFAYGTEGSIQFSMDNPNNLEIFSGEEAWQKHECIRVIASGGQLETRVIPPETPSGVLHWHTASIASFLTSVSKSCQPSPSVRDGLGVDLVLESSLKSIANGSNTIQVSEW